MIKNGKVFSLELHMDQSFVYHLKLVISRLPSQIPWWEQPSVTFRYLLHTIAIASALFHWTYTGTCQTNRLTTILLCVSQCYYRLTTADPFFQTHQLKCQHCDNFVGLRFCWRPPCHFSDEKTEENGSKYIDTRY